MSQVSVARLAAESMENAPSTTRVFVSQDTLDTSAITRVSKHVLNSFFSRAHKGLQNGFTVDQTAQKWVEYCFLSFFFTPNEKKKAP